jgi:hypothetical protein
LVDTKSSAGPYLDHAMPVAVPIDEMKSIGLAIVPTASKRDIVESVTLKSFRKVIGYDTFNSILRKDRDENVDPADHYNVTVSIMVRRDPVPSAARNQNDPYNGLTHLSERLDKGFPYDDGDNTISYVA